MVNDARQRSQHELDVVALGRDPTGAETVLALGEAKHTTAKRTVSGLERLEHIRTIVAAQRPSASSARLLLFSANGFDRNTTAGARGRQDVELIDLRRLYVGD